MGKSTKPTEYVSIVLGRDMCNKYHENGDLTGRDFLDHVKHFKFKTRAERNAFWAGVHVTLGWEDVTEFTRRVKGDDRLFEVFGNVFLNVESANEFCGKRGVPISKINRVDRAEYDLFEDQDKLPPHIKAIVDKHSAMEQERGGYEYSHLEDFLKEIEPFGFTFDYGLCAEPYKLRMM